MTGIEIIELLPDPYRADMKYGDERSNLRHKEDECEYVSFVIGFYCLWSDTELGSSKWDSIQDIFFCYEKSLNNKLI